MLFGTDTPLYHTATQRAGIEHADLSESDQRLILHGNALRLFGLNPDQSTVATSPSTLTDSERLALKPAAVARLRSPNNQDR